MKTCKPRRKEQDGRIEATAGHADREVIQKVLLQPLQLPSLPPSARPPLLLLLLLLLLLQLVGSQDNTICLPCSVLHMIYIHHSMAQLHQCYINPVCFELPLRPVRKGEYVLNRTPTPPRCLGSMLMHLSSQLHPKGQIEQSSYWSNCTMLHHDS